ncbi:hypothetical protein ABIF65_010852 [Bradyrhizobium japonicum]|jgi:hypothetical protein|nr:MULTISPECIES: hypothetical protein [Bradyrhizobium]MBR0884394.1 hypothetical protein [Bradyrhizobium liaoningense]MBR0948530.1 hypothetical protein [Bradyrhizobium liaoningense]MBR1003880.1 hypothetical protein [Bradyrhizobium liaoningense]MBR1069607.1 hypothetical protein [Bradyrhizobium liaoningense]MCP1738313.1 hypothetical protein [Bradyrhizobium japonicum]
MASSDPRRGWWNAISPVSGPVTSTPSAMDAEHGFGDNVVQLIELGFLVDQLGVITVVPQTMIEAAALVGLNKADIVAAWNAP